MQLNEQQREQLLNWIRAHWVHNAPCPMCNHSQWGVNDVVFELREFFEGNMVIGGRITPIIPITCSNCGNTVFLNALHIGLVRGNQGGQQ